MTTRTLRSVGLREGDLVVMDASCGHVHGPLAVVLSVEANHVRMLWLDRGYDTGWWLDVTFHDGSEPRELAATGGELEAPGLLGGCTFVRPRP